MAEFGWGHHKETSGLLEPKKLLPDSRDGLGERVALSPLVKPGPAEFSKTGGEVPVFLSDKPGYFSDKPARQPPPKVFSATSRIEATGQPRESGQVELKLRFSIDRSGATKPVDVKVIRADKAAKESPATIKALANWIAEDATKSLFESLKAGAPVAEDKFYLIATSDSIANLSEQAHQLVGTSVEVIVGDVAGLPPGFAEVAGGVAKQAELPSDDLIEDKVTCLRLTGMTIDVLSGGLPVAELLDFIFDKIKKAFADRICEALTPQARRSQAQVDLPSIGKADLSGPNPMAMNRPPHFATGLKSITEDPKPQPGPIIKDGRSQEVPGQTKDRPGEVPTASNGPALFAALDQADANEPASRLGLSKAARRLRTEPAAADRLAAVLARFEAGGKEPPDKRSGPSERPDWRPSILAGQAEGLSFSFVKGRPSIKAGQPSADDDDRQPLPGLGKTDRTPGGRSK